MRPQSGIRVLDMSRALAGPWAAQMLGDFGADVIKIERPGTGDEFRIYAPFMPDKDGKPTQESTNYLSTNRNKRSIGIDLAHPKGQALVRKMVATADVLIENYKIGDLKRYGLDYESLRAINPRLIYCSITAFGQDGPYAQNAGYDSAGQSMGGVMSLTGEPDGPPQKVGYLVADLTLGNYATIAILSALHSRERTGLGQHIDVAMLDTQVAMLSTHAMQYFVTGEVPRRQGVLGNASGAPSQPFVMADGWAMVSAAKDDHFQRLCEAIGLPELATDPRFVTMALRAENRKLLGELLSVPLRTKRVREWQELLAKAKVICTPIYDVNQVFEDPQVEHRGMKIEVAHPIAGRLPMLRNPIRFSATPLDTFVAPPTIFAQSEEILHEFGLSEAEIKGLVTEGVVAVAPRQAAQAAE
jgi:crotonobetainyl-CoA:carnitine CoA-transferase CaiB-like acyl-CoA transferase